MECWKNSVGTALDNDQRDGRAIWLKKKFASREKQWNCEWRWRQLKVSQGATNKSKLDAPILSAHSLSLVSHICSKSVLSHSYSTAFNYSRLMCFIELALGVFHQWEQILNNGLAKPQLRYPVWKSDWRSLIGDLGWSCTTSISHLPHGDWARSRFMLYLQAPCWPLDPYHLLCQWGDRNIFKHAQNPPATLQPLPPYHRSCWKPPWMTRKWSLIIALRQRWLHWMRCSVHLFHLKRHQFSPTTSEKQKKSWSSAIYDHFCAPEILLVGNMIKYVFICKRYGYNHSLMQFDAIWHNSAIGTLLKKLQEPSMMRVQATWFDMQIAATQKVLLPHKQCSTSFMALSTILENFG